jgi:hypothetical protein
MASRAASPRVLLLATVVAAHAGVLLVLLTETRTRAVRGEPEASALIVMLLEPRERETRVEPRRPEARSPASRPGPAAAAEAALAAPAAEPAPGAAIDWTGEAALSAARQIEADEHHGRQRRALAVEASPVFAARPQRPGFHWSYAATHRVEAVGGLATVIHLNDQCAIALFLIIPFAGGCALEKPPPRGDLFEHMHDPDPAPEP